MLCLLGGAAGLCGGSISEYRRLITKSSALIALHCSNIYNCILLVVEAGTGHRSTKKLYSGRISSDDVLARWSCKMRVSLPPPPFAKRKTLSFR